jgi:pimeloyl-ACP methyl ester carboxylesterase
MDHVEIDGLRIAFRREGHGPPLLLLHGWPSNNREWRRQVESLSDEFTVFAWDAPGAGESSDPPETFRLPDWADCLAAFIAALELERPHVAGLSFGGGLALELYRRHPAVPRTLILVSAYAGWGGSLPAETVHERLQLMLKNMELPWKEWGAALLRTLVAEDSLPVLTTELESIFSDFHPVGGRSAMRGFAEADLRDVLPRINVPTLLLYGEKDVRTGRAVWEALHSQIPGSKLVVIPGVGHMIDMEAAGRFDLEVRAFLRAVET